MSRGANDVAGRLRLEIIRRKLDTRILVNNCGTIDLCDIGPNIVVYPDNVILSGVTLKDVTRVCDYLAGGEIPADLVLSRETPKEQLRARFYAAAVGLDAPSEEEFASLVADHGFDSAWISDQLKRGFLAKKPDSDGIARVSVTSKARTRYGV
ncbi:MAG: (2Fe-2S) ferredoxin domain-containing protein [Chloroflexota bacterium]|nr:(2Fe-2S) ferredoxin domain-containing protein [Chloroflexota bacterium]